jgi:hypothetical protein
MDLTELEFSSLRHTIALRGTVRIALVPLGVGGWAALATTLVLQGASPLLFVFPLLVLAAIFEATNALHAGVERIGRYVQLRYESGLDGPRWESTAMGVGPALPGGGVDPLFTLVFAGAAGANLMAAMGAAPARLVLLALISTHAALFVRLWRARRAAGRQRSAELARMSDILQPKVRKSDPAHTDSPVG